MSVLGMLTLLALCAAPDAPFFEARGNLDWLTAGRGVFPRQGALPMPEAQLATELRPNLKLEYGTMLRAVVRPRLSAQLSWDKADEDGGDWSHERFGASAEWTELYGTWQASESFLLSYGLQNFQWGPAELASPSNRLFHETGFTKDLLYHVRGKHLVRANLSFGKEWSAVALVEVADNAEAPFVAGEAFTPQGLLKLEWASSTGTAYLGLTGGVLGQGRPWFGEYAQLELVEGLSVYLDASHSRGSRAWYPKELLPEVVGFEQRRLAQSQLLSQALGGLRYSFENGVDLRAEYLFHQAGYTNAELKLAAQAVTQLETMPLLAGPLLAPGFEFLGQQLVYLSVRIPDLPPRKHLALQARYLHSLTDASGAGFLTATWEVSDAWVAFASGYASHGPAHGELSRLVEGALSLGTRCTF